MLDTKSQNSNMLLAFLTLTGVIAIVALVGFFMLRKGPEIVQGQAEVTEYRVSSKVPGRILEFRVKEGQSVQAGDTLAILEAPDVQAKLEQARAAESAAQAQNEKALKGARREQIQAAYEMFARIDISDTGSGIPETEQAKIFARFYRSNSVQKQEGVGIGLYLARQIISGEGGYIKVASVPGKGSTFSIFLPK